MVMLLPLVWNVFYGLWVVWGIADRLRVRAAVRGESVFSGAIQWSVYGGASYVAIYAEGPFWTKPLFAQHSHPIEVLGFGILVSSLFTALCARFVLGRNWSGVTQLVKDHALITAGPYRFVRNPIYAGIMGGFAGTLILHPTIGAATGCAGIVVFYLWKVPFEESFLRRQFGAAYDEYSQRTYSLVPFIY